MFNGRVDGDLAVARAFGDFNYKRRKDLPPEAQEVSCEPEVLIRERHENDAFLLFACFPTILNLFTRSIRQAFSILSRYLYIVFLSKVSAF